MLLRRMRKPAHHERPAIGFCNVVGPRRAQRGDRRRMQHGRSEQGQRNAFDR
jgi:hypothetical protein